VAAAAERTAIATAAEAARWKQLAEQKQLVCDAAIGAPRQQRGVELAELRSKQRDAETSAQKAAELALDLYSRALAGSPLGLETRQGVVEKLNLDGGKGGDDDDGSGSDDDKVDGVLSQMFYWRVNKSGLTSVDYVSKYEMIVTARFVERSE